MAQLLKQQMNKNALRMPLQRDLLDELNVEKYELTKTGRITFNISYRGLPPPALNKRLDTNIGNTR